MSEHAQRLIAEELDSIRDMLLAKNRAYGNSALEPLRIFSKADAAEATLKHLPGIVTDLDLVRLT